MRLALFLLPVRHRLLSALLPLLGRAAAEPWEAESFRLGSEEAVRKVCHLRDARDFKALDRLTSRSLLRDLKFHETRRLAEADGRPARLERKEVADVQYLGVASAWLGIEDGRLTLWVTALFDVLLEYRRPMQACLTPMEECNLKQGDQVLALLDEKWRSATVAHVRPMGMVSDGSTGREFIVSWADGSAASRVKQSYELRVEQSGATRAASLTIRTNRWTFKRSLAGSQEIGAWSDWIVSAISPQPRQSFSVRYPLVTRWLSALQVRIRHWLR